MRLTAFTMATIHRTVSGTAMSDPSDRIPWPGNQKYSSCTPRRTDRLAAKLSPRVVVYPRRLDDVRRQLDEYFAGHRRRFELRTDRALIHGFARHVLAQTARIPYGSYLTYAEVAAEAGSPRAHRAAGNALARNPIPIVIPCHRVLRSGGAIGNYGGGPEMKARLLQLEGARVTAQP